MLRKGKHRRPQSTGAETGGKRLVLASTFTTLRVENRQGDSRIFSSEAVRRAKCSRDRIFTPKTNFYARNCRAMRLTGQASVDLGWPRGAPRPGICRQLQPLYGTLLCRPLRIKTGSFLGFIHFGWLWLCSFCPGCCPHKPLCRLVQSGNTWRTAAIKEHSGANPDLMMPPGHLALRHWASAIRISLR